jgi:hypothetical protein
VYRSMSLRPLSISILYLSVYSLSTIRPLFTCSFSIYPLSVSNTHTHTHTHTQGVPRKNAPTH